MLSGRAPRPMRTARNAPASLRVCLLQTEGAYAVQSRHDRFSHHDHPGCRGAALSATNQQCARPHRASSPQSQAAPGQPADAPSPALRTDTCLAYLKAAGFEIEPAEPQQVWNELCWNETPVRLKAVPIATRQEAAIQLTDKPILACRFAGSLDRRLGRAGGSR